MGTPVSGASQSSGNNGSASGSNSLNVTGQQFLQLLVAQLKYQNPLQPLDSGQFLSQLATLEQVQLLEGIQSDLDQLVKTQAATPGQPPAGSGG
jgi:flagellar basal-body rod modification protein FlgD